DRVSALHEIDLSLQETAEPPPGDDARADFHEHDSKYDAEQDGGGFEKSLAPKVGLGGGRSCSVAHGRGHASDLPGDRQCPGGQRMSCRTRSAHGPLPLDRPAAREAMRCPRYFRNLEVRPLGGGSHFVQADQPEAIGDAIREWRRRILSFPLGWPVASDGSGAASRVALG